MSIAWTVVAIVVAIATLFCAGWCYFDPDREFRYDEKRQRKLVRRYLLGFFVAPVWPMALLVLGLYFLVVLIKFAFPRVSEDE